MVEAGADLGLLLEEKVAVDVRLATAPDAQRPNQDPDQSLPIR